MKLSPVKHDRENSPAKTSEDPYSQGGHKKQKVLVVSLSNTVINPGTVMIKTLKERGGGRGRERERE